MCSMYVLIAKIPFDIDGVELGRGKSQPHEARFYRHLAAKLRAQQRVCAYIYHDVEEVVLAVTALAPQRDTLLHVCEQICALCEREGLGRVAADVKPLIAHIDSLS